MSSAARGASQHARFDGLLILLAAAVLMAPELVFGLTLSDSFHYNLVWGDQFSALFRQCHLYPRWLPLSWHGLGSPTFYFYPPLFFWVSGLIDALTAGALPTERLLPLGSLVLLAGSGAAMYAWLRAQATQRAALFGAIAYMAAPYHLYDIYGRGALAEASAYAFAPLIALSLRRILDGRAYFLVLLATSYAGLLFTHLPLALLASVFLIPPYVVFEARRSAAPMRFLVLSAAGGLIGAGIAAIYWIPAIGLLPTVSAQALSATFYRPENWFPWRADVGPIIGPICIAALFLGLGVALGTRRKPTEAFFWSGLAIVLLLLIAGVVPPLWSLPGIRMVQFPWRALVLVEFATVTAIALGFASLRRLLIVPGLAMLGLAYVILTIIIVHLVGATIAGQAPAAAAIRADYRDAPEYLPAGTKIIQANGPMPLRVQIPPAGYAAFRLSLERTSYERLGRVLSLLSLLLLGAMAIAVGGAKKIRRRLRLPGRIAGDEPDA